MRSAFGAWHALCSRARLAALEAAHEQLVGTHESALAASAAQLQALREALGAGLTEAMEARGTLLTREEFHEWHATTLVADAGEAQDELLDLEQWVAGQSAALPQDSPRKREQPHDSAEELQLLRQHCAELQRHSVEQADCITKLQARMERLEQRTPDAPAPADGATDARLLFRIEALETQRREASSDATLPAPNAKTLQSLSTDVRALEKVVSACRSGWTDNVADIVKVRRDVAALMQVRRGAPA